MDFENKFMGDSTECLSRVQIDYHGQHVFTAGLSSLTDTKNTTVPYFIDRVNRFDNTGTIYGPYRQISVGYRRGQYE